MTTATAATPRPTRARRLGLTDGWLTLLILAELVTLLVAAVLAVRTPVWSPVDELGHYGYVEQIVEHRTLPVLNETTMPQPVLSILEHGSANGPYVDPAAEGLYGYSYEAFQPPLYYLVAAPVFAAVPGYVNKVYALRALDVVLLLATAALGWILCRDLLGRRWRYGYVAMLGVLLLPGLVLRSVAISNAVLALPLAMALLVVGLRAVATPSWRRALFTGVLLGACVLTELQLVVLAPIFAVALWRLWRQQPGATDSWCRHSAVQRITIAAAIAALPLLMLAPWLAFNLVHFHALTGEGVALQMQNPIINPAHVHYSLRILPDLTVNFLWDVLMPQEWYVYTIPTHPVWQWVDTLTKIMIAPFMALAVVAAWRSLVTHRVGLLAIPYVGITAILWFVTFGTQWNVMLARYSYWALPSWALLGATALLWSGGRRFLVAFDSMFAGIMVVSWVALARDFLLK